MKFVFLMLSLTIPILAQTQAPIWTNMRFGPNGYNYGLASYGWIQPPLVNVPLFNLEQDITTGLGTAANPLAILGVYGGLDPVDNNGNLFVGNFAVRDKNSAFNVANLGALGGSAAWFGQSGKGVNFLYGVIGASYNLGTGNVGENWGVRALATYGSEYERTCLTCFGTITNNKGLTAGSGGYFGTITNDYSIYVEMPTVGATITNPHIGIYITDQTNLGNYPTAWDIVASGASKLGTLALGGYPTAPTSGRHFSFASGQNFAGAPDNATYTAGLFLPTSTLSSPPSTGFYGVIGAPLVSASSTVDWTGKKMVGVLGAPASWGGIGTGGAILRGVEALGNGSGGSPLTENTGVYAVADNTGQNTGLSTGNIINQYAGYFQSLNSNSHTTTTNSYGVYIAGPPNTANLISHNYGLYIENPALGSGNTDPHGIVEAGSAPNDLGGGVTKVGLLQEPLSTPASSSAACVAGQMWADASFVYVCTSTNTIKRAALSSF